MIQTLREWVKPLLIGALGVVLVVGGWMGYIHIQQHNALWIWANQADGRIRTLERKLSDQKPGDPLPPGAYIEDGEKYGFPKGTKVTVMPPIDGSKPAKETPKK